MLTRKAKKLPEPVDLYYSDEQKQQQKNSVPHNNTLNPVMSKHNTDQLRVQINPKKLNLRTQNKEESSLDSKVVKMDKEKVDFYSQWMSFSHDQLVFQNQYGNHQYSFDFDEVTQKKPQSQIKQTGGQTHVISSQSQDPQKKKGKFKKSKQFIERKIRTTVSQEKVKILEYLFPFVLNGIPYRGVYVNLKDVSKIVNLGYSTVLHKYKYFRNKGTVQKGLLLKCKDIKRKYGKSVIIENYIKEALSENVFKTAKQLANYISSKHNIHMNRSIISRHLNDMKREKSKMFHTKNLYDPNIKKQDQKQEEDLQYFHTVNHFCKLFLALKSDDFSFQYLSVIRLYLEKGKLVQSVNRNDGEFKIINLVITATESHLLQYYPSTPNDAQVFLGKKNSLLVQTAYKSLYEQLQRRIEQYMISVENSNKKVYVIFPFGHLREEFDYRQQIANQSKTKEKNILVMPPRLQSRKGNFIHQWFSKEVFPKVQNFTYPEYEHFKTSIMELMNQSQKTIWKYSVEMFNKIRKIQ